MRVAVLTSLYPSAARPFEGIFAERRWLGMRARGHDVRVVQPLPFAPPAALARALGRADWAAVAASPRVEQRGDLRVERPRYLHLPGRARGNAERFAARGVAAIAAEPAPDVVVCDYAWPAAAAVPELAARGVPAVVSGRGSDVLQVAGEAGLGDELARCLRAARGWCAVSADLVQRMDVLAGPPGRGVLVPNGVDLERFAPGDRGAARARLGLPAAGVLVLCVGHLIERKDPLLALAAFVRGAPEGARLAWVGRGPLRDTLRRAADEAGLGERLLLPGEQTPEQLAGWYTACDALLLTSRREGRPNVVLEALASGRPVVATAAGGTGELLDGLPGLLVESRHPEAVGDALAAALAGAGQGALAPAALRARVEPLSWDASFERLEACLRAAIEEARAA